MNFFRELYAYREMIISLVRKDLRGRYKGSVLGFLWTFLNPLLQLAVFTVVFSVIMKAGYEQYYIFLFVALVPWIFFSTSIQDGSICVIKEKELIKKIYFPRAVLPVAAVTGGLVNMVLVMAVLLVVIMFSGRDINFVALLFLPVAIIVQYILCLGIAMLVSGLTVYFRDLQYILGIVVMALQYMTPVMYGTDMVPAKLMFLFRLNPMTPVIEMYRSILYYAEIPSLSGIGVSAIFGVAIFIAGSVCFSKLQRGFAETF